MSEDMERPPQDGEAEENPNPMEEGAMTEGSTTTEQATTSISGTDDLGYSERSDVTRRSMVEEGGSVFRNTLSEGFAALRTVREADGSADAVLSIQGFDQNLTTNTTSSLNTSSVLVNFIDPTTASATSAASDPSPTTEVPKKEGILGGRRVAAPTHQLELYDKLKSILENEYNSTLHSVPYQNIRSGANEIVDRLPLRSVLTRSHGAYEGDASSPWGGTAAGTAAPVSDPAEWHNGPYCHVYIAACESLDHYRTKVRPSLQAFVSQIEGAANNAATPESSASSSHNNKDKAATLPGSGKNYSAHYLIVYVPTGSDSGDTSTGTSTETTRPAHRVGAALASRIATARRQMAQGSNESLQKDSDAGSETDPETNESSNHGAPLEALATLSKSEKELYRKFTTDFPNAKTCVLSTLKLDTSDDASSAAQLKQQEWNSFLRSLGVTIMNGFRDRCRRYNEELRRLDSLRASPTKPAKSPKKRKDNKPRPTPVFDLSHFFLVKESLAFTYEQVQLPSEALLQYKELQAFVPDSEDPQPENGGETTTRRKSIEDFQGSSTMDTLMDYAVAGNRTGFRRRLRSLTDLRPISHIVLHYIFARETYLLVKMAQPVQLVKTTYAFVVHMHDLMFKSMGETQGEQVSCSDAERWAVTLCWDVHCACLRYSALLETAVLERRHSYDPDSTNDEWTTDRAVARELSDLLEFARGCFLRLGDSELEGNNPIRATWESLPEDMQRPWSKWKATTNAPEENGTSIDKLVSFTDDTEFPSLLADAFTSAQDYESSYLNLATAIVALYRFSGRHRFASSLQKDLAELFIRKGELKIAMDYLLQITDVQSGDKWAWGHFYSLFRLACCQRTTMPSDVYLKTLTQCFSPRVLHVAPWKTLNMIHSDLNEVVGDSLVAGSRCDKKNLFDVTLDVADSTLMRSVISGRKIMKHSCNVGEKVRVVVGLRSYLPRNVDMKNVRLLITTGKLCTVAIENKTGLDQSKASEVLQLDDPEPLKAGHNVYNFEWTPLDPGKFVLSMVEMQWNGVCFFCDSLEYQRHLVGIDVKATKPTQTITLEPKFLIPGQTQEVKLDFCAGEDTVVSGTVVLKCSQGLELLPPGETPESEAWADSFTVALDPRRSGESTSISFLVKSSDIKSPDTDGTVQKLLAEVESYYRHSLDDRASSDSKGSMKAKLETKVTTLEKPALSVGTCHAFPYLDEKVIICVSALCNTPVPYSVKKWKLQLPGPLRLVEGGDMNSALFEHPVAAGDELCFSFHCIVDENQDKSDSDDGPKLLVDLQEGSGVTFTQPLSFDLSSYYEQISGNSHSFLSDSISVQLDISSDEGMVGAPVTLTYSTDASKVPKESLHDKPLLYSIAFGKTGWLVVGKTRGVLKFNESGISKLQVVAIPTSTGDLKQFPSLSLSHKLDDGSRSSVQARVEEPSKFKSLGSRSCTVAGCPELSSYQI